MRQPRHQRRVAEAFRDLRHDLCESGGRRFSGARERAGINDHVRSVDAVVGQELIDGFSQLLLAAEARTEVVLEQSAGGYNLETALYLMTLLTAPWLLRRGQHVRLDLILTVVPQRVAWLMEAAGDILGFIVCVVLIRYGTGMAYDSWRLGAITIKNLVFPEWWLLAPLPTCFILLAIEFIFRFHRLLLNREKREEATSVA